MDKLKDFEKGFEEWKAKRDKQIEEMANKICFLSCKCDECNVINCRARIYANRAIKVGYGNVKEALTEFAEKVREEWRTGLKCLTWEYGAGASDAMMIFEKVLDGVLKNER